MKEKLKSAYKFVSGKHQTIHLEYKVEMKPRFEPGNPHPGLNKIIDANRAVYQDHLEDFLRFKDAFLKIRKRSEETDENLPGWNNDFLPGLDIVALYGMIARYQPETYVEIGSGNSTQVVRKAINDLGLSTKIISIDPFPRANIDHLADVVIREPIESLKDYSLIENLKANDILFIDNSHRAFPNSDVTVCMLELLPSLQKDVVVHIHDIYLPYDYPQFMCDRAYSEQYLLAPFIIANPEKYETICPNFFISEDESLSGILRPIWENESLKDVEQHGGSYWLKIN